MELEMHFRRLEKENAEKAVAKTAEDPLEPLRQLIRDARDEVSVTLKARVFGRYSVFVYHDFREALVKYASEHGFRLFAITNPSEGTMYTFRRRDKFNGAQIGGTDGRRKNMLPAPEDTGSDEAIDRGRD